MDTYDSRRRIQRVIQQAARIQELERFATAHADDLAGVRGACDERIARAEAAFNTARDQLVEELKTIRPFRAALAV